MVHIVSLDSRGKEIENLIKRTKTMIIHGADVKCIPYGMVAEGDVLYFVNNDNPSEIKAKGIASSVYNSCQLSTEESFGMIIMNQGKLSLPDDLFYKWAGKRYLVLIETKDVEEVQPFYINRINSINTDGWYSAVNIEDLVSRNYKIA